MSCLLAALLSAEEQHSDHHRTLGDEPEDSSHRPRTGVSLKSVRQQLFRRNPSSSSQRHLLHSPPLLRNYDLEGRRPRRLGCPDQV